MKLFFLLSIFGVYGALIGTHNLIPPRNEKEYQEIFINFIEKYNKSYSHQEFFSRYETFKQNLNLIEKHNNSSKQNWTMEINEFIDMNSTQFRNKLGFINNNHHKDYKDLLKTKLPKEFDWEKKGAVTPIKNQGNCGSCWAFSTTGSIEGAWYIANNDLLTLSEQELISCSGNYGNDGCNGGLVDQGYQFVMQNGLQTEKCYPYQGIDSSCIYNNCNFNVKISSYHDVIPNDEDILMLALYQQPISVAIDASHQSFQFYSNGVFNGDCGTELDHAVLLVGWGEMNGEQYWKVKNSWGSEWGDNGYIYLARNISDSRGQCGITMSASYPIV